MLDMLDYQWLLTYVSCNADVVQHAWSDFRLGNSAAKACVSRLPLVSFNHTLSLMFPPSLALRDQTMNTLGNFCQYEGPVKPQ